MNRPPLRDPLNEAIGYALRTMKRPDLTPLYRSGVQRYLALLLMIRNRR